MAAFDAPMVPLCRSCDDAPLGSLGRMAGGLADWLANWLAEAFEKDGMEGQGARGR